MMITSTTTDPDPSNLISGIGHITEYISGIQVRAQGGSALILKSFHQRFDKSVVQEDRKIIREVMEYIEENTCVTFIETYRRRYKYLTIFTQEEYNCIYCYYLGLVCPLRNGGSVRSSPFCTKEFNCPYYYGSVGMSLSFTLPFCGRLSKRWKALITHELLHSLGLIHTQNRPDRDNYISINEDAIDKKSMDQYMPKCYACNTFNLPYECNSIMHYGRINY